MDRLIGLVALRINLELAAEQTESDDAGRAEVLRGLGTDVESAINEVRSVARDIYPGVHADRGLVDGFDAGTTPEGPAS